MCGIVGFHSVSKGQRAMLASMLAVQADSRGGHACGLISFDGQKLVVDRSHTAFGKQTPKTIRDWCRIFSRSESLIFHTRYATCGKHAYEEIHPYELDKLDGSKLYGVHNGVVSAEEHAKARGRPYLTDSKEVFHTLVDGEPLSDMSGYGVLAWNESNRPDVIRLLRASHNADLVVYSLKQGGYVFGSTSKIVKRALAHTSLKIDLEFKESEPGQIFEVKADGCFVYPTDSSLRFHSQPLFRLSLVGMSDLSFDEEDVKQWNLLSWEKRLLAGEK